VFRESGFTPPDDPAASFDFLIVKAFHLSIGKGKPVGGRPV